MDKPANTPLTLSPHLICAGAAEAIKFYEQAFGAREMLRLDGPDGKLMHAGLSINGATVMLVDENRAYGMLSPKSLGGTPVTLTLGVEDADKAAAQAVAAGAKVVMPVADMFWGDRYGIVEDPFGHRWAVAQPQRKLSAAELKEAAREAMCGDGAPA